MSTVEKVATVFLGGLVGVAMLSALVSGKSNTPQVLNSAGGAISGSLTAAQGG